MVVVLETYFLFSHGMYVSNDEQIRCLSACIADVKIMKL